MKILIADDDAVARRVLESLLAKWGYEVVAARDGTEAWEALEKPDAPRLALLDWVMPGMGGTQICKAIRATPSDLAYTYILLLTGKDQPQDIIEGLEAGADDYLTKPFDANELKARLRTGIRILELQEALRVQATQDALTGVWNRRAILDALRRELARADRQGTPVTVIILDLDHFKRINDTYGHLAGDAVLREAARRMQAATRIYDAVGRYGGEEFLIVFPGCDAANAMNQAERLRECLARAPIESPEGALTVTASLGVAVGDGRTETDALLRGADAALYRAKHAGRNRVELAAADELSLSHVSPGHSRAETA